MKGDYLKKNAVAIGKKGGSICSTNKKLAAKLRAIKLASPKNKEEKIAKLVEFVSDPCFSSASLYDFFEDIKNSKLKASDKIRLLEVQAKIHQTVHGSAELHQHLHIDNPIKELIDEVFNEEKEVK